jgi:hypothetical protein
MFAIALLNRTVNTSHDHYQSLVSEQNGDDGEIRGKYLNHKYF